MAKSTTGSPSFILRKILPRVLHTSLPSDSSFFHPPSHFTIFSQSFYVSPFRMQITRNTAFRVLARSRYAAHSKLSTTRTHQRHRCESYPYQMTLLRLNLIKRCVSPREKNFARPTIELWIWQIMAIFLKEERPSICPIIDQIASFY